MFHDINDLIFIYHNPTINQTSNMCSSNHKIILNKFPKFHNQDNFLLNNLKLPEKLIYF